MKRYYATQDIAVSGTADAKGNPLVFRAGDELVGVPVQKIPNLLRTGQAAEAEESEQPKITPPPAQVAANRPVEPRKAGK